MRLFNKKQWENEGRTGTHRVAESAIFLRNGRQSLQCGCHMRRHNSYQSSALRPSLCTRYDVGMWQSHARGEGLAKLALDCVSMDQSDFTETIRPKFIHACHGPNYMALSTCKFHSYRYRQLLCYTTCVCGELIQLQVCCVKFKTGFLKNAIKSKFC